jgi:hypothetical protein
MVLARDSVLKDTVVFVVLANDTAQLKKRVRDYYDKQGWSHGELTLQQKIIQVSEEKPVQSFGHALEDYQDLQSQIERLCQKVMECADSEMEEGYVQQRDNLYAFLATFDAGKKLIEAKYGEVQS